MKKFILTLTAVAAIAECAALYTPEHLLALIGEKSPQANDIRLRSEIKKRVLRIEVKWSAKGAFARIIFVNGATLDKGILFTKEGATLCQQTSFEDGEYRQQTSFSAADIKPAN